MPGAEDCTGRLLLFWAVSGSLGAVIWVIPSAGRLQLLEITADFDEKAVFVLRCGKIVCSGSSVKHIGLMLVDIGCLTL